MKQISQHFLIAACIAALLAGCAPVAVQREAPPPSPPSAPSPPAPPEPPSPSVPAPAPSAAPIERGRVSLYGDEFAGKTTASGDVFDPNALTMAHRSLPFGTRVRVTNTENQRSVEVTVTDRGPFVAGRIADLSLAAARQIGMVAHGVVEATLEVLRLGSGRAP